MVESLGETIAVVAVAAAVVDAVLEHSVEDVAVEEPVASAVVDATPDVAPSEAEIVEPIESLPAEGSSTILAPEVAVEAPEVVVAEPAIDNIEAPVEVAEEPSEVVPAVTVVVEDESGETAVAVEVPAPEHIPAPAEPVARPKSPWTPSYSVVRQGSVPPDDVEELEQLPSTAVEVNSGPEVAETTIPIPVILTEVFEEPASDSPTEEVSLACVALLTLVMTRVSFAVQGRGARCGNR